MRDTNKIQNAETISKQHLFIAVNLYTVGSPPRDRCQSKEHQKLIESDNMAVYCTNIIRIIHTTIVLTTGVVDR